jgi:hypothetical protein
MHGRVSEADNNGVGGLTGTYNLYFTGCQPTSVVTTFDDSRLALTVNGQNIQSGGFIAYGMRTQYARHGTDGPDLETIRMISRTSNYLGYFQSLL